MVLELGQHGEGFPSTHVIHLSQQGYWPERGRVCRRVQDKKCTWLVAQAPAEKPSPHHVGMAAMLLSQGFLVLFSWAQTTAELQGHPNWLHAEASQALDPITKLSSAPHPFRSVFCVDMGSPPLSKVVVCLLLWLQGSTTAVQLQESSFQPPEAWSAGVQRAPAVGAGGLSQSSPAHGKFRLRGF